MKIFDFNNPRHIQILREELSHANQINKAWNTLKEFSFTPAKYNEDNIWSSMSPEERKEALNKAVKDNNLSQYNNSINTYIGQAWDSIPDDLADHVRLYGYQLASDEQSGRSYIRGIEYMRDSKYKREPDYEKMKTAIQKLIDKFCKNVNREFDMLTLDQAMNLNIKVQNLLGKLKPRPNVPYNPDVIGAMIDADKESGRYHRGSLGD